MMNNKFERTRKGTILVCFEVLSRNLSEEEFTVHARKAYRRVGVEPQSVLNSAVDGCEGSDSHLGRLLSRYPLNRRLDGPTAGMDNFKEKEISCPCQKSNNDSSVVHPVA
jgi:hypothetical protein